MIDGKRRPVDDYQPRKQIEVAFTEGKISVHDDEQISAFADKYIVNKRLVIKKLESMEWNGLRKEKRESEKKASSKFEDSKKYDEFDWVYLCTNKGLEKMKVQNLDKYLTCNRLETTKKLKKKEKIMVIRNHILLSQTDNIAINLNALQFDPLSASAG